MCTGGGGGSFNPGMGPTQNLINPRQNINSNEYNLRRNILPDANGGDAIKALNRSIDEVNARNAAAASRNSGTELLEEAPDTRGTGTQRRKPRSLLSAAGGVGDTSSASIGASMAKAVLGA